MFPDTVAVTMTELWTWHVDHNSEEDKTKTPLSFLAQINI